MSRRYPPGARHAYESVTKVCRECDGPGDLRKDEPFRQRPCLGARHEGRGAPGVARNTCDDGVTRRGCGSEPAFAPEVDDLGDGHDDDHGPRVRVPEAPVELGHVVEVLPIDTD